MAIIDGAEIAGGVELAAEVVVVGAGPVGITLGLELADRGHDVLLVESGGRRFDAAVQHLGGAAEVTPPHVPMELATRRQLGGASNLWGGRCVPFDPVDFERREIVGDSTWPVGYDDLEPYFQRACEWCVCGDAVFDARRIPALAGRAIVPGFEDGEVGASALERWSLPTNFGKHYRRRLRDSRRMRVVLGLTCTEVVCRDPGTGVDHLALRGLGGRNATARGSKYVLAAGGLETTRLLFASDRMHSGGIGNHSGHLGHWYMAHVEARIARVRFATPPTETIYGYERDDGVYVRRRFTFSPALQRRCRLPNAALWPVNPKISDPSHGSAVLSFVYLMLRSPLGRHLVAEGIRQAHVEPSAPVALRSHLTNVARGLPAAVGFALSFGYQRFLTPGRRVPGFFVPSASNVYPLLYHGEHLPSYDSRVKPSGDVDALGMPRLETDLRFSREDIEGAIRAHRCMDEALRSQGLGRLEYLYDDPMDAVGGQLFGGYHQAGTTRMSSAPGDGVVSPSLAVHGFDDLFLASSSVFVTSSQANSTLTAIALALRLADHLHGRLIG